MSESHQSLYPPPRLKRYCPHCDHRWDVAKETEPFFCRSCGADVGCHFHTDEERERYIAGHREDRSWWTAGT